jgi:hypothetical protein
MIYSIVGTKKEIRESANKELARLGSVTQYVYSENAFTLESYIDATTLFDGIDIVICSQLSGSASSKERLIQLLPSMEVSPTIFIIDEPFADVHLTNKLTKVSVKVFNAKEEKIKDTQVFTLCDSFAKRDKKQAWIDFTAIRNSEEGEAMQGALWWKFQIVWQAVRAGKRTPYNEEDCARIGGELVRSSIRAHRGEVDLKNELERIILSL